MRLRRWLRIPHHPGDSGSVIVAMLAALIVGGLVVVIGVAALAGQKAVRFDRDFTMVIAAAEAGVQEGVFRLNVAKDATSPIPAPSAPDACTDPLPSTQKCVRGTLGEATYQWYAVKIGGREWDVHSSGRRNGRVRTVVARVKESREFFASAFADLELNFNGGNVADTYSSGVGSSPPFTPRAGRLGIVGSNGEVRVPTGAPLDGVQLWNFAPTPAGYTGPLPAPSNVLADRCPQSPVIGLTVDRQYNASSYNPALAAGISDPPAGLDACSDAAQFRPAGDYGYQQRYRVRRAMTPTGNQLLARRTACRNAAGGLFSLLTNFDSSLVPTLAPVTAAGVPGFVTVPPSTSATGDFVPGYYCFRETGGTGAIKFSADFNPSAGATLTNPVEMVAFGDVLVGGGGSQRVNCQPCNADGNSTPVAGRLRIYVGPTDDAGTTYGDFLASSQKFLSFALAAPKSLCRGGAQNEVYGSLICQTIDNTGGWLFHYDAALETIGNKTYSVASLQERT